MGSSRRQPTARRRARVVTRAERSPRDARGARAIVAADPAGSASAAGLRYVSDASPGIRRVRSGKGFRYERPGGELLREPETLARIRALAIPPAWTDVWICPDPRGHLQATGRDARRRKQYRYHPRWREVRDETKYGRMLAFARALPTLRERIERDLSSPGLTREKVLAVVVRLLETTLIRVGNEEYARQNRSFGLTTLRSHHVDVSGSKIEFRFRGKGGKQHVVGLNDRRLSRIVKRCQDLPGYELFQYCDEEAGVRSVDSADVNAYLREGTGQDFTAKDFRTWAGTVLAAWALQELDPPSSKRQASRNLVRAVEAVAGKLGNTPSICRRCYVHPAVLEAYLDGSLVEALRGPEDRDDDDPADPGRLSAEEAPVLRLLVERLARDNTKPSGRRGLRAS